MSQKAHDFIKPRGSKLVLAKDDDYYIKVKEIRARDQQMTELNNRIAELERQVNLIKDLLRGRCINNAVS